MRQNILVLDDDNAFREELVGELEYGRYACRSAARPEQILQADWQWADVAIVDLGLAGGDDGPAFLRRMRAVRPEPDLVLVSGHDPMVLNAATRAARDLGYVVLAALGKPLSLNELLQTLEGIEKCGSRRRPATDQPKPEPEDIVKALRANELSTVFQPKISLKDGICRGVEAQLRWDSAKYGVVPASQCVQLAEQSRRIAELTGFVFDQALAAAAAWQCHAHAPVISITLPAGLLENISIIADVVKRVQHYGIPACRVTFGLNETTAVKMCGKVLETITRLRLAGFGLSLEDFGAGQNRFERFIALPLTELKLDRRFADAVLTSHGARILQGIAAMCHSLGMQCVADGVETPEQAQALRRLGCDMGLGWFLGRPVAGLAIRGLLPDTVDIVC